MISTSDHVCEREVILVEWAQWLHNDSLLWKSVGSPDQKVRRKSRGGQEVASYDQKLWDYNNKEYKISYMRLNDHKKK